MRIPAQGRELLSREAAHCASVACRTLGSSSTTSSVFRPTAAERRAAMVTRLGSVVLCAFCERRGVE